MAINRIDPLLSFLSRLGKFQRASILLMPLVLLSTPVFAWPGKQKIRPATDEQIFLYRGIGSSYVCNARAADIEFPKAVGIAAATYTQLLNGHHGGRVASAGRKKLTNKQLFAGAEFQIITGALQFCPKEVPPDVKEKVEEAIKKQKK